LSGSTKVIVLTLAISGVFAPTIALKTNAGIVAGSDHLAAYDGQDVPGQPDVDATVASEPQPLPSLQDLSTFDNAATSSSLTGPANSVVDMATDAVQTQTSESPLLLLSSTASSRPAGSKFVAGQSSSLSLAVQASNQAVNAITPMPAKTGRLAFWSDTNPASAADILAAFQNAGMGTVISTVLASNAPTSPVDVSAYVVIPLSNQFLSDGGVPEPSTYIMWMVLGTGTLSVRWWRRRKRAL
jgi:hypothetical protein